MRINLIGSATVISVHGQQAHYKQAMKVLPKYVPLEPFYVLVSGGVDSIAVAHWLKYSFHKKFKVLHFNHNVQPANNAMEQSVRKFCTDFEIDCVSIFNADPDPLYSEDSLRRWRLLHMADLGGNFVTGHHLNDAVENYLSNCLCGNPEHKPIAESSAFMSFTIYHPFLSTTKHQMVEYIARNNLRQYVVEDPTNDDTKHRRNWIRNTLLTEIYKRNVGIETVVRRKFYNNV